MPTVRVAVYDLGSTSFHLMVVDAGRDGTLEPVLRRRSFLHLGAEVARAGSVGSERLAAAVRALRRLHAAGAAAGPDVTVALATAAVRDAGNGKSVLRRFEEVLDVPIRLLDGGEEARLCFVGQRAGVWTERGRPVIGLDLGGGSLEACVGDAAEMRAAVSVPIGTARMAEELDLSDPPTPRQVRKLARTTASRLGPVRALVDAEPEARHRALASGGTVRALARLAMGLHRPPPAGGELQVNQVELPTGQLHQLTDRLVSLDLAGRLALPGVQQRRAALLPAGAVILSALVDELGLERLVVSDWGLREGAVLDALRPVTACG